MPKQSFGVPQIHGATVEELRRSVQFWFTHAYNVIDRLGGARGTPTFLNNVNANGNKLENLADVTTDPTAIATADTDLSAVPRKATLQLLRQPDGTLAFDARSKPVITGVPAVQPAGLPTLQQVMDLINNATRGLSRAYFKNFGPATTWTVLGSEHGFGKSNFLVQLWDASSPRNQILAQQVTKDDNNFNVVVTWGVAQGGQILLLG